MEVESHASVVGTMPGFQDKLWSVIEIFSIDIVVEVVEVVVVVVVVVVEVVETGRSRKKGMVELFFFREEVVCVSDF